MGAQDSRALIRTSAKADTGNDNGALAAIYMFACMSAGKAQPDVGKRDRA